jgi:tetratricopeptide (TPR) repeat protein
LALWDKALSGTSVVVRLQAPFGGGRRALVGEFMRQASQKREDAILWRVPCLDQENGFNWMIRMYGSLIATLSQDALRKGRAEMVLNAQLPAQPKRVQAWFQQFVSALKDSKADAATGQVELRLPKDNPLIGLCEVVSGLSRRTPVVLELQNPHVVNSLALSALVESLLNEAGGGDGGLMVILHDEPESDATKAMFPMPLLDFYNRGADRIDVHAIAPWGADETSAFLTSKALEAANPGRIAEIATGRPGFIAELIDILNEGDLLGSDLADTTLAGLAPMTVDADELEADETEAEEGKPTKAGPADANRMAYLAALLGQGFPSGVVAAAGGWDPESVDDLVDAMDDLFDEVQFSKEMGTWIYRFSRGCWREGVIEAHRTEDDMEIARRMGLFMERNLVPRGAGFVTRTARVYAEHGAAGRAHIMRSLALSKDHPDLWGLIYDLTQYFDEIKWPDSLRKTVWMNLLDRLVANGNVQLAEKVHTEATAWATENEDRELNAWLLFNGSRLDTRRQDLYRARDRATDALTMYEGLDNKARTAEIHNHIAMIELQDGNVQAALDRVTQALEAGKIEGPDGKEALIPAVAAAAEHIRGTVARRTNQIDQAAEHFRRANEIAGQTGQAAQAVDSALAFGEALLASGKSKEAADVLGKVVQMSRALRNPMAERTSSQLLSQAAAAQRQFDIAIQNGTRALQLSQQLKLAQALPIDLYNLGYFHFAAGKHTEAIAFLTQAEQHTGQMGGHPMVKELKYFKGMAQIQSGQDDAAKDTLEEATGLAEHHKDWGKLTSSLDALGGLAQKQGDKAGAKAHYTRAVELAGQHDALKELRKPLRKKLQALS